MSIRIRILIPMIALTIACCFIVLLASIALYNTELDNALHSSTDVAVNVAHREINDLKEKAYIAAFGMSSNPDLIEAVRNNDRDEIAAVANSLKNVTQLDFCTILDSDGIVLIRTHASDRHGDSLAELSHVKSALEGKIESHLVKGATIELGVMAGVPIYDRSNNIIGVVSLGFRLDIQDFAYRIKDLTDCEVKVYIDDRCISATVLNEDGSYAIGTIVDEQISERVLNGEPVFERIRLFGRDILAKYVPLSGVNNEIVGMLFVGHYTEEEAAKIVIFVINGVLITIFVVLLSIIVAIFISRFVERRLAGMMDNLRDTSSQLETALNKANTARRTKSMFLSNMSHEMRTPLNAIIGMTQVGQRTGSKEGKEQALSKISDASAHLLGLVNDLLDMARIEADELELSPASFDFSKMLDRVLNVIYFQADEKKHTLTVNTDNNIPRYIVGDEKHLGQVITSLLANAVKFTPEGGKISLDAFWTKQNDESGELRLEVTDNGIGITPEQQKKMFEAFEQVDKGTNRKYAGVGLGLSITKHIVELMGGEILAESEFGKGSKFIITLKTQIGIDEGNNVDA